MVRPEETFERLWRMLLAHVDAARELEDWREVRCVGADEMSVRKGHVYLTVFADLEAKRVLFGVEGKDSGVWGRFTEELEKRGGEAGGVEQVVMDMSRAYMNHRKDRPHFLW
ncbi:MAG: transposase [Verrucomicrobia bacterium]|nr:transposase [Verrucomicrobiota bacterium]